jgi:hypothetical protein
MSIGAAQLRVINPAASSAPPSTSINTPTYPALAGDIQATGYPWEASAVCQWVNLRAPETKNICANQRQMASSHLDHNRPRNARTLRSALCRAKRKNVSGQVSITRPNPSRRFANSPIRDAHTRRRRERWIPMDGLPRCPSPKWRLEVRLHFVRIYSGVTPYRNLPSKRPVVECAHRIDGAAQCRLMHEHKSVSADLSGASVHRELPVSMLRCPPLEPPVISTGL